MIRRLSSSRACESRLHGVEQELYLRTGFGTASVKWDRSTKVLSQEAVHMDRWHELKEILERERTGVEDSRRWKLRAKRRLIAA